MSVFARNYRWRQWLESSWGQLTLLTLLMLFALLLRLYHLERWLPIFFEEARPLREAIEFWGTDKGAFDFNPHWFEYPAFSFYIHFIIQAVVFGIDLMRGQVDSLAEFRRLLETELPFFILLARWTTVLFDLATVGVTYLLGRRLDGPRCGMLAALFIAFNYTHIREAQLIVVDVPLTFFTGLTFLFALDILKRGKTRDYLKTGFSLGVAVSVKYTVALMGSVLGVILLWKLLHREEWKKTLTNVLVAGVAALLVFACLNPFILLDRATFLKNFLFQYQHITIGHFGLAAEVSTPFFYLNFLWSALGVAGLAAVGGMVETWRRRRAESGVLYWGCLFYLVVISSWQMKGWPYTLPVFPLAFVLGASAIVTSISRFENPRLRLSILLAAIALYLGPQAISLKTYFRSVSVPDTRIEAKEWMEKNIPPTALVAAEAYTSAEGDASSLTERFLLLPLSAVYPQTTTPFYDLRWYDSFDYIITSSAVSQRYMDRAGEFPAQQRFYNDLEQRWQIAKQFTREQVDGIVVTIYQNPQVNRLDEPFTEDLFRPLFDKTYTTYVPEFLHSLADMLWKAGLSKRAIEVAEKLASLEKLIPTFPRNACLNFHIFATEAYKRGDRENAIALFQRSVELKSEILDTYVALAYLLEKEGRDREVGHLYIKVLALELTGIDAQTYAKIGRKLLHLDQVEDAAKAYRRALGLNDRNLLLRTNLGWCLYLLRDLKGAAAQYAKVLQEAPNSVAMFNLGLVYIASGERQKARAVYAQAVAQFGAEEGKRIGAVRDLKELEKNGAHAALAQMVLRTYWPGEVD